MTTDRWKLGNELLPFHPSASHVEPGFRDGWNAALAALEAARPEGGPCPAWLTECHALCSDFGVPPGAIGDRIRALRDLIGRAE